MLISNPSITRQTQSSQTGLHPACPGTVPHGTAGAVRPVQPASSWPGPHTPGVPSGSTFVEHERNFETSLSAANAPLQAMGFAAI